MPSVERQRPPSLPRTTSSAPLVSSAAMACCAGATFAGALHPLMALVVLRSVQLAEFAARVQRSTGGQWGGGKAEIVASLLNDCAAGAELECAVVDARAPDGGWAGARAT